MSKRTSHCPVCMSQNIVIHPIYAKTKCIGCGNKFSCGDIINIPPTDLESIIWRSYEKWLKSQKQNLENIST